LEKKIKILTISDLPLSPSGVANQTRNMIEGLLKTGKYQFVSLGGAIKHRDYKPIKTEEWGEDWVMYPVDGYGNANIVRDFLRNFKPDVLWFMTDPRFWGWLWAIDNEIRKNVNMVYYTIWDHYPPPYYNKPFYDSNDCLVTISRLTDDVISKVSPDVRRVRIPHAIDTETFKKLPEEEVTKFKKQSFQQSNRELDENKFILFWNNRNARRKMSGTLIFWFKEFLDKVGHDKATFIMHTDPKDPNGQDLKAIVDYLGLTDGQVLFSTEKIPGQALAMVYNMADCVVNIANAEGFGLGTAEALACETPILVNMTGGLQEQVTDGEKWFGLGLHPVATPVIGSQDIPYIYEEYVSKEYFLDALEMLYNSSKEERAEMGRLGREHVLKNFNIKKYIKQWDELFNKLIEENGSWETRKNYQSWKVEEV